MQLRQYLDENHGALRAAGWRLLQPFRFGPTDEAHTSVILDVADLPQGARVLDVGCGVGEMARLMHAQRPDLHFTLVNFSQAQLADCPQQFELHLADAHALPFDGDSFDCVMFHAALGNMDVPRAMAEAVRVLRPGGTLLVNELLLEEGDGESAARILAYRPIRAELLGRLARFSGMLLTGVRCPEVSREYLRECWPTGTPGTYDEAMAGVFPAVARYSKQIESDAERLARYKRPALHFSGGKDSLACLYLLRGHLDKLTVYWLNTGDGCPETLAVVEQARQWIPHFVEVRSDVATWRIENGFPSDAVPAKTHRIGVMYGMSQFGLSNRFDCCSANIMAPMNARMLADGVDLVIRGTKATDTGQVPAEGPSGPYDVWLPIRDWSHEEVFDYLREVGAPVNPIYEHFKGISAPECMGCTAWWDDGKAAYLKARHPDLLPQYRENLRAIRGALASHLQDLETEIGD